MKVISVVSGKGGVGKTTSAINLSAYLNSLGYNVLLIDANVNTPDVGLSLGAPVVPISLQHVLSGKNNAEDAIYTHHSGTKVMPSSLSISSDIKNLGKIIGKLKNFDFVIIDSAAGLGDDVLSAMKASDECLIVTNPELPALTGALKTINAAEQLKKPISGILVTRKAKNQLSLKNIKDMLDYPIIGLIPEDNKVKQALTEKETLLGFAGKASKSYETLALNLISRGSIEEKENFFEKIINFVKIR